MCVCVCVCVLRIHVCYYSVPGNHKGAYFSYMNAKLPLPGKCQARSLLPCMVSVQATLYLYVILRPWIASLLRRLAIYLYLCSKLETNLTCLNRLHTVSGLWVCVLDHRYFDIGASIGLSFFVSMDTSHSNYGIMWLICMSYEQHAQRKSKLCYLPNRMSPSVQCACADAAPSLNHTPH